MRNAIQWNHLKSRYTSALKISVLLATDGQDGNSLQLENVGPSFSSSWISKHCVLEEKSLKAIV